MKKNEAGFSVIELILILIIVALLGGVGWYTYKARNSANKGQQDNSSGQNAGEKKSNKTDTSKLIADPTEKWIAYSSAEGQYNFKYPPTWVIASNLDWCNPGLVLLGANASSVGKCATESFGQVGVASNEGDTSADNGLGNGFINVVKRAVTVNNVVGSRQSGAASGQQGGEAIAGLADGTKVVKYIFFTNGRTYTATYTQNATYPDALSDFDLLVTKTLKFTP